MKHDYTPTFTPSMGNYPLSELLIESEAIAMCQTKDIGISMAIKHQVLAMLQDAYLHKHRYTLTWYKVNEKSSLKPLYGSTEFVRTRLYSLESTKDGYPITRLEFYEDVEYGIHTVLMKTRLKDNTVQVELIFYHQT